MFIQWLPLRDTRNYRPHHNTMKLKNRHKNSYWMIPCTWIRQKEYMWKEKEQWLQWFPPDGESGAETEEAQGSFWGWWKWSVLWWGMGCQWNQPILREINLEYLLEGLRLKLKRQYFGHLMQTDNPLENSDAGKDWGQKEKRSSKDEMAGRHHLCNGYELGRTLGDGEGQRGLVCCSPWGHKESDMTG